MFDSFLEYMNFKVQNRYDLKLDIVGEDAIVGTYLHLPCGLSMMDCPETSGNPPETRRKPAGFRRFPGLTDPKVFT